MDDQITFWLQDTQLPIQRSAVNRWYIDMSHRYCDYTICISRHGNWLSYGADLIGDVSGHDAREFYRRILAINNKLNGTHIALEGSRFILIRDDFLEDVDQYNLYRSLDVFHDAHEYVYNEILDEAKSLNVYFS